MACVKKSSPEIFEVGASHGTQTVARNSRDCVVYTLMRGAGHTAYCCFRAPVQMPT